MVIGIIGAGASGMAAAIAAAQREDAQVILLERQARVGRKLLATGNGRCNLSNLNIGLQAYHGQIHDFPAYALEKYDLKDTLQWFKTLGLLTTVQADGRIYPYSDQANSVVDVLRFALDRPNITLKTGHDVSTVRRTNTGFQIESVQGSVSCDRLIVACGGVAGAKLGGSMSGYQILAKFGHTRTPLRPSLVQLRARFAALPALKGVRANCHVRVVHNGSLFSESTGEIQFTEYGLSGPVIFEVSRDVCREPGEWLCSMDLLPCITHRELFDSLSRRRDTTLACEELLTGILHNRLGRVLVKMLGLNAADPIRDLTDAQLSEVCSAVKAFELSLTEPLGMDSAQVTAGGMKTNEFDPMTMQSRLVSGLYACGEVLDVDGDCGGYNLQWAWSSGRCAGEAAGKEEQ